MAIPSLGSLTAGAAAPTTFRDTTLPGAAGGGEPSIAVDTSASSAGKDAVYVTNVGVPEIWHSLNLGQTWSNPVPFDQGSAGTLRGGDEDVTVLPNGNVLVADLNVSHNTIQLSTDHAQTFNNPGTVSAPESDREWFGVRDNNVSYLAYHDFVGEIPIVCTSTDGGNTYPTCVQAFTNSQAPQCAENTVMGRPVSIDPTNGNVLILYACSTAAENAAHPPFGPLHDYYLATSSVNPNGIPLGFTTQPVFTADVSGGKAPNFSNIFSALRVDSQGNLYMVFAGTADDNHPLANPYHVYFTTSTNHGASWTTPLIVDNETDGKGTHTLPDMTVTSPGNVDIVYLSTPATGEPNGICGSTGMTHACPDNSGMAPGGPVQANWVVTMAQSTNALALNRSFSHVQVSPGTMHTGEICTNGIVCGSSDRSLLDYISVAVDCSGNAHVAYTENNNTGKLNHIHEADQLTGQALTPPSGCSPSSVVAEFPLLPALPLLGLAAAGAGLGLRRRRTTRRAAA
jgi:hypothetical protein